MKFCEIILRDSYSHVTGVYWPVNTAQSSLIALTWRAGTCAALDIKYSLIPALFEYSTTSPSI